MFDMLTSPLQPILRSPLSFPLNRIVSGFFPSRLFASGEQGAWYDPSDRATLFQDSAGTTPVTAVEQPVGLQLDTRFGLALGSELRSSGAVGLAGTATVATYNTSTGVGSVSRVDGANQSFVQWSGLSTNYYVVTISCTSGVAVSVRSGSQSGTNITTVLSGASTVVYLTPSSNLITVTSSSGTASFTLSSIRELPGNHAFQTTTTSRPVLSARYNLLTNTEALATQTVTTRATTQTLRFEGTGTVTLSGTATGTYSAGSHSVTTTAGNLTLTVSGTVTKADLRAANMGVGLPAYQQVNTSTDYDADPAKFPPYLRFDGVDDWLQTNSIDFTSTDKMTVFAGVRKLSDAASGMVTELSSNAGGNTGTFHVSSPSGTTANDYNLYQKGTIAVGAGTSATFVSPVTNVLTGIGDISGDSAILRVNGTQAASSTADQGTGNYGNYPLYIGRRGGTTLPFNGQIYSLIVRGAQTSTTQIAQTETWVNGKTKAY